MDDYQRYLMNEPSDNGGNCRIGCLDIIVTLVTIPLVFLIIYGVLKLFE